MFKKSLPTLIVEDEALIAFTVKQMLQDIGYDEVFIATTLTAALDLIVRKEFGFAILDVNLGRTDLSYPIAAKLDRQSVPYAFATGYQPRRDLREMNSVTVLEKPIDEQELKLAVDLMYAA